MKKNATFLTDGYKLDHRRQYPEGTEYVYSTWIPRSNNYLPEAKGTVVFGIQYLIKEYFIKYFNEHFFNRSKEDVVKEFEDMLTMYLGDNNVGTEHIAELHDLGYLPIKIKALPEGSICPIKVPCMTIINTHPKFFWVTNFLETIISNVIWLPMTSATIAKIYKDELTKHAKKTGFYDEDLISFLCHDFSMRGMGGLEASVLSGMGHLTSFVGSETIPALTYISEYYPCNSLIANTIPATEHSVMCAGGDGEDEFETFKRLITKTYPKGFVSIVSDTWDFWKVMTDYLPRLKDTILNRDGKVVIRPDSGCPEDIICGLHISKIDDMYDVIHDDRIKIFNYEGKLYKVNRDVINENILEYGIEAFNCINYTFTECLKQDFIKVISLSEEEVKGAYEILWDIFGGTTNEKGYKVLNPKVGIIYGDSITIERQKEIYRRLEEKGFCASNLVLGIGSYTYQYKTRDSLGFAMKATWCQINGESKEIYKQPKTDNGTKNSLKGLCAVFRNEGNGNYEVFDQVDKETENKGELKVVFENGKLIKEHTLEEIRERLCKQ